ncbi:MAG: hypothetical protein NXI28_00135 [bacterium]|nr:hypothetical protein [bacterium]
MNRLCEQCGSDNAKLYCRWPAVLCVGCAEKRLAAGDAEVTSEAREAPLYSLADLHRRRTSLARRQGQSEPVENVQNSEQIENANVRHGEQIEPPENVQHAAQIGEQNVCNCRQIKTPAKPKPIVAMDVLARLDNVFRTAQSLKDDSPLDAFHVARGLLNALLRLSIAKAQGKIAANPDPDIIPLKLFSKGVMAKPVLTRFRKAMEGQSTAKVLECCLDLFRWLASDDAARIGSVAKAR